MREPFRVLVTGSRNWPATRSGVIDNALRRVALMLEGTDRRPVLIHGACPKGADHMADILAPAHGYEIERYPADWKTYGKPAGYRRNADMVNLGADICLAFPLGASKGTRMCMRLASEAGIPVLNFGDE